MFKPIVKPDFVPDSQLSRFLSWCEALCVQQMAWKMHALKENLSTWVRVLQRGMSQTARLKGQSCRSAAWQTCCSHTKRKAGQQMLRSGRNRARWADVMDESSSHGHDDTPLPGNSLDAVATAWRIKIHETERHRSLKGCSPSYNWRFWPGSQTCSQSWPWCWSCHY